MAIKYIGAPLKEGCTITGADLAIDKLKTIFTFDAINHVIKKNEDENASMQNLNTVTDFLWRLKSIYQQYKDDFVVTVGGDHSLAIASISGHYQPGLGVIWVDAHGDSNTDLTSISKRIHGVPLSVMQGLGEKRLTDICEGNFIASDSIVLFGISSLDEKEETLIKERNIKMFTLEQIKDKGLEVCLDEAISYLSNKKVYFSFDLDSIDKQFCSGVNTPVKSGFSIDQVSYLIDRILNDLNIIGMDVVEYNPLKDDGNTIKIIMMIKSIIMKHKG
ncbi:MAG: arginase family protein [Erysipelotrichaceae bacterium]|nr:arginase family protein [Erysipelotrichaceae bacterium]